MLIEMIKKYVDVFGILPRFLGSLLESKNVVCNATAGMKTSMGIHTIGSIISRRLF